MSKTSSEDKKAKLQAFLNRQLNKASESGIPPKPDDIPARLSPGQLRLWFLQQLYPGNPFYHYAALIKFEGNLNIQSLTQSFQIACQPHDILRATFPFQENGPILNLPPQTEAGFPIETREFQDESQALEFCINEGKKPFNLEQGPLLRAHLIHISNNQHWFLLNMHHTITDKWSTQLLLEDWAKAYQTLTNNKSPIPGKLPIQYHDFAHWDNERAADTKDIEFWTQQLSGDIPALQLPLSHPKPLRPSFKGAFVERYLPDALALRLTDLSKRTNTTIFTLLLAAFKLFIHKYTGEQDLLLGTPVSNRDKPALQKLVGFFNETLVIRTQLDPNASFLEYLSQVRQQTLDAFEHKNTPFERIVQQLRPERNPGTNPLFQMMFLFHNTPPFPNFGPQIKLTYDTLDLGVAKFDLTLYFAQEGPKLKAIFEYATDLFEEEAIHIFLRHLFQLLHNIVEDPNQRMTDLSLMSDAEVHDIISQRNTPISSTSQEAPHFLSLFDTQVRQNPSATAVTFNDTSLSYQELNLRANTLAASLLQQGITPHTPVGLKTERSLEMITGIIGIMKAGAAYVPLDPEYPEERLNFMIQDAGISIILTEKEINDAQDASFDPPTWSPADLAYIIYTSGSTGNPKGVGVTQQNLYYSTVARFDVYPQNPKAFLLLSSFSFDSSVAGIFWTLATGGNLCIPPKRIEQDVFQLGSLIKQHKVTHTLVLPTLYHTLLGLIDTEDLESLTTVIVAGEACTEPLVRRHHELLSGTHLYNEYGPTEATVWCIAHNIEESDLQKGFIPIGKAIPGAAAYILDRQMKPVPDGVSGDLYIGGKGITRGYLNNDALTQQKFVPNPFSNQPEDKLYKTGDLARFRKGAIIEFLGRADQQVKIRGYRIELDEINNTLLELDEIQESLIRVYEDKKAVSDYTPEEIARLLEQLPEAEQLLKGIEALSPEEATFMIQELTQQDQQ